MIDITPFLAPAWVPGPTEMIVVGVIMLLLFGSRLPSVMRNLGRGVTEFKRGIKSTEDEVKKTIDPPVNPPTERSDSPEE